MCQKCTIINKVVSKTLNSGFSLIELMIAISIMAVLIAATLSSYRSIQSKARDEQRKNDLKIIQSALEQYKADQGYYPAAAGFPFGNPLTFGTGVNTRTYLNKTPQDSASTGYIYQTPPADSPCNNDVSTDGLCMNYCIFAKLENPPATPPTPPSVCGDYPADYNYYVTQP